MLITKKKNKYQPCCTTVHYGFQLVGHLTKCFYKNIKHLNGNAESVFSSHANIATCNT